MEIDFIFLHWILVIMFFVVIIITIKLIVSSL